MLLYEVISLQDISKDKLSVKMSSFLEIYLHEQSRRKKLDDLEAEKEVKNGK